MKTRILIASAGLAVSAFAYAPAPVVFDTPAKDEKGIMVLGNGEVGATAWLDASGTLHSPAFTGFQCTYRITVNR